MFLTSTHWICKGVQRIYIQWIWHKHTVRFPHTNDGLSPGAVVGIVVGGLFLLLAAAVAVAVGVVKFTHCSIFDMKKNKQVLKQVSEDEPCLPAQNGEVWEDRNSLCKKASLKKT